MTMHMHMLQLALNPTFSLLPPPPPPSLSLCLTSFHRISKLQVPQFDITNTFQSSGGRFMASDELLMSISSPDAEQGPGSRPPSLGSPPGHLREQIQNSPWRISDLEIDYASLQGGGAYGKVYTANWKGTRVAVKILHHIFFEHNVVPEDRSEDMLRKFIWECDLLHDLHHPHIVQFLGIWAPLDFGGIGAPLVMVTELLSETLRQRISRSPPLTLIDNITYSLEIAVALRYLHERARPIAHRDLSSTNIMLTANGSCKLVDLGIAKVFSPAARLARTIKPGQEHYMPGEVMSVAACYNEKIDVFSLAVVMVEMANCHEPRPLAQFLSPAVVGGQVSLIPETERRAVDLNQMGVQHPLYNLVVRMLQPQDARPDIGFVQQSLNTLRQSLVAPPAAIAQAPVDLSHAASHEGSVNLSVQETGAQLGQLHDQVSEIGGRLEHLQHVYSTVERQLPPPPPDHDRRPTVGYTGLLGRMQASVMQLQSRLDATERQLHIQHQQQQCLTQRQAQLQAYMQNLGTSLELRQAEQLELIRENLAAPL